VEKKKLFARYMGTIERNSLRDDLRPNRRPWGAYHFSSYETVIHKSGLQFLVARIGYDQIKELYFQNPQFGFRLLHLIVGRMQSNAELALPDSSPSPA
jgi:hypothetical protein